MPETAFNHQAYQKNLDKLVDASFDYQKTYHINIVDRQLGLIKTYLWTAAFIMGAQLTLLGQFKIPLASSEGYFLAASAFLALASFTYAVDTLRGRKEDWLPEEGPRHLVNKLYKEAEKSGEETHIALVIIDQCNEFTSRTRKGILKRGLKLKGLSKSLSASLLFVFISLVIFAIKGYALV